MDENINEGWPDRSPLSCLPWIFALFAVWEKFSAPGYDDSVAVRVFKATPEISGLSAAVDVQTAALRRVITHQLLETVGVIADPKSDRSPGRLENKRLISARRPVASPPRRHSRSTPSPEIRSDWSLPQRLLQYNPASGSGWFLCRPIWREYDWYRSHRFQIFNTNFPHSWSILSSLMQLGI